LEAAIGIEPMNKGLQKFPGTIHTRTQKTKHIQGQHFRISYVLPWSSVNAGVYYIFYYSYEPLRAQIPWSPTVGVMNRPITIGNTCANRFCPRY
jgi:hypothetical protein